MKESQSLGGNLSYHKITKYDSMSKCTMTRTARVCGIYACKCVCVCVCIYIYIYTYVCMHACIRAYVCT